MIDNIICGFVKLSSVKLGSTKLGSAKLPVSHPYSIGSADISSLFYESSSFSHQLCETYSFAALFHRLHRYLIIAL